MPTALVIILPLFICETELNYCSGIQHVESLTRFFADEVPYRTKRKFKVKFRKRI